jgi:hypothetical protein
VPYVTAYPEALTAAETGLDGIGSAIGEVSATAAGATT